MRMKYVVVCILCVAFLAIFSADLYAQGYSEIEPFQVKANIPPQNGFAVSIYRIQGDSWLPTTSVDFGDLYFDAGNSIFRSYYNYAVDVSVSANLGNWAIDHDVTPFVSVSTPDQNIDYNLNVTFVKRVGDTTEEELAKKNYSDSNGKVFTKGQLAGGRLRIYYDLATGDSGHDAPGASPIGLDKPTGRYLGQVILTVYETI